MLGFKLTGSGDSINQIRYLQEIYYVLIAGFWGCKHDEEVCVKDEKNKDNTVLSTISYVP